MHYYIYILFSVGADKYYIGYSNDFYRRLNEHNEGDRSTYTKKHRPWVIKAIFDCGLSESDAMRIEKNNFAYRMEQHFNYLDNDNVKYSRNVYAPIIMAESITSVQ